MKKIIAMVMAAILLCSVSGVLAEEGQIAPLYATVGEALDDDAEGRVVAGGEPGDYFAVVTKKDGKYYRSVALYDEKLTELEEAVLHLDYDVEDFAEKLEAATKAEEEYQRSLPIAYSEEFTAQPLTNEEMDSMLGYTLSQLTDGGFEIGSTDINPDEEGNTVIAYILRHGVFDYICTVDADVDSYDSAVMNGTEGDLIVTGVSLAGITEWGFLKRFHTDGTVEEPEDPFAVLNEITAAMEELSKRAEAGEEIDIESFINTLKEKYPDSADMIDSFMAMYQLYSSGDSSSMQLPAE